MPKHTDKYLYCNHYHELTDEHELVDFGDGEFVANKAAIPLLKALNEAGLRTHSHNYTGNQEGYVCILLDEDVNLYISEVNEGECCTRTRYDGMKSVNIVWNKNKRGKGNNDDRNN